MVALRGMFRQVTDLKKAWDMSKTEAVRTNEFSYDFFLLNLTIFFLSLNFSRQSGWSLSSRSSCWTWTMVCWWPSPSYSSFYSINYSGEFMRNVFNFWICSQGCIFTLFILSLFRCRPHAAVLGNVPSTDTYLDLQKYQVVSGSYGILNFESFWLKYWKLGSCLYAVFLFLAERSEGT